MKKTFFSIIALLFVAFLTFCLANAAFAGRAANRRFNQQNRIYRGIQNSALTKGETMRLKHQQRHITCYKNRAWSDGNFTRNERLSFKRMQNRASYNIFNAKHNNIRPQ